MDTKILMKIDRSSMFENVCLISMCGKILNIKHKHSANAACLLHCKVCHLLTWDMLECFSFVFHVFPRNLCLYFTKWSILSQRRILLQQRQKVLLYLSKWTKSTLESANCEVTDLKRTRLYDAVVLLVDRRPRVKARDDPFCLVPVQSWKLLKLHLKFFTLNF